MFKVPNKYRVKSGPLGSTEAAGNNGAFLIPLKHGQTVQVIASAGVPEYPWEHVSVSRKDRCPTWDEMCQIKAIFWDEEDAVVQYHPPKSEYVNIHQFCLHLWRPTEQQLPMPPSILVG